MSELIEQEPLKQNVKTIHVRLPMMNGLYDLVSLAQGLDYKRTDLLGAIEVEAILDGSERLQVTIEPTVDDTKRFEGRGVYVHGPFSVRLDPEIGVFKVNALKQVPGLVLLVAVRSWRKAVTLGVTQ
jgi:hypothetical protein